MGIRRGIVRDSINLETSYQSYINDINKYPLLDFKQEQKLGSQVRKGDKKARETLIKSNLKLVVKMAVRYNNFKYNIMDMIQDGNMGLMIAVDKFDYRRKLRFSTYSTWWIRHYIMRGILKKKFQINVPLRKIELLHRIERTAYRMVEDLGRVPNMEELEKELRVGSKRIIDIIDFMAPVLSLDSIIHTENNVSLMDITGSTDYDPEVIVFNHHLIEYELNILNSLIKRDAEILKYRYGFNNGMYLTLKKVAKIFNITPEAVRQIELKAFRKIRLRHKGLKSYIVN